MIEGLNHRILEYLSENLARSKEEIKLGAKLLLALAMLSALLVDLLQVVENSPHIEALQAVSEMHHENFIFHTQIAQE